MNGIHSSRRFLAGHSRSFNQFYRGRWLSSTFLNLGQAEDKEMEEKSLFIGEIAKQTGVNPKTIRYYEGINLLPKPKRERNNYRFYSHDTVTRLNFIKKAQSLGFTLREIKEILALRDRGFKPCTHVRGLLKQKIIDLDQKLAELITLRHGEGGHSPPSLIYVVLGVKKCRNQIGFYIIITKITIHKWRFIS